MRYTDIRIQMREISTAYRAITDRLASTLANTDVPETCLPRHRKNAAGQGVVLEARRHLLRRPDLPAVSSSHLEVGGCQMGRTEVPLGLLECPRRRGCAFWVAVAAVVYAPCVALRVSSRQVLGGGDDWIATSPKPPDSHVVTGDGWRRGQPSATEHAPRPSPSRGEICSAERGSAHSRRQWLFRSPEPAGWTRTPPCRSAPADHVGVRQRIVAELVHHVIFAVLCELNGLDRLVVPRLRRLPVPHLIVIQCQVFVSGS